MVLDRPLNDVAVKEKIGYLAEDHRLPEFLKGRNLLSYFARLAGVKRKRRGENIDRLLELVDMKKWQNTRLKNYSKGMLQRLGLAQAMMNDPDLLFLDEPTDGVDPIGRKEIRDVLLHLKEEGKTIFVNSHLLSEVEMICDEVAILDKGKLIRTGTVAELTSESKTYRFETSPLPEKVIAAMSSHSIKADLKNGFVEVTVSDDAEINTLIDYLRAQNVAIRAIVPHKHSLEESFIEILKKDMEPVQ
jgi:ABC-2 type transport system ATP-binding protein